MASDRPPRSSHDSALRALDDLRADRARLAGRLRPPRWLAAGFGLVAAAFIATPAVPEGAWRNTALFTVLVAWVALSFAAHHTTGIKLSRVGPRASLVTAAGLVATLLLLSVSYGLAAGALHGWIAGCALVGFLLVTYLVGRFLAAVRGHLSHGR